jgi:hypothetical protein
VLQPIAVHIDTHPGRQGASRATRRVRSRVILGALPIPFCIRSLSMPASLSRFALLAPFALSLLLAAAKAQTSNLNSKVFFTEYAVQNGRKTDDQADTLYMMPDRDFHVGARTVTGFEVVLKDEEQSTSEYVQFGIVKASSPETPDTSPSGEILNLGVTLFGINQGGASYLYAITLQNPIQVPEDAGVRLILPQPRNKRLDMCSVQYRPGNTLSMSSKAPARTYTHYLSGTTLSPWMTARSIMHAGFLYDEPVTRVRVRTHKSAYGSEQTLIGPESVHIDATRGDTLGWSLSGENFKPAGKLVAVGLPILGLRAATPLPTPWGSLELDLGLPYVFLPASVLDGQGDANAGFAPPPVQVKWCIQTLFCLVDNSDPQNPIISQPQLSDATVFETF